VLHMVRFRAVAFTAADGSPVNRMLGRYRQLAAVLRGALERV
jgi:hypothetical protein